MACFERERDVYQHIAARSAATVVGVVDIAAGEPPQGFDLVALDSAEPLAREWTVAVLTPRFGAVLAAVDRETVDASAATLETGRLLATSWALRRDAATYEVQRLRRLLALRLPSTTRCSRRHRGDIRGRRLHRRARTGCARGSRRRRIAPVAAAPDLGSGPTAADPSR